MSAKIIQLPVDPGFSHDAKVVLERALKSDINAVVILGWCEDGCEYMATSIASGPEVLWLTERMKQRLMGTQPSDVER
ncbi:MAG: hypothetical protein GDA50_04175 [Alphaproteobacteria bacterium GM202ARS2]|nr:hypothetical protein [Alphaproteobacteria bacterium GM202ARS2]